MRESAKRRMVTPTPTKGVTMKRRSYVPFIVISAMLFVTGLLLGAGKSADDTSAVNTASKLLLSIGLVALLVTALLEMLSRRRARYTTTSETRQVSPHDQR